MLLFDLTEKPALITGASSGFGEQFELCLLALQLKKFFKLRPVCRNRLGDMRSTTFEIKYQI